MNFSLGVKFLVAYYKFDWTIQDLIDCIKMIILVWMVNCIIRLVTLSEMYYLTYFTSINLYREYFITVIIIRMTNIILSNKIWISYTAVLCDNE